MPFDRRQFCMAFGALAASGVAAPAQADDYPSRPVRFMLPFPPGFAADMLARSIAQELSGSWGQQVIVENHSGAGGVVGTEVAARAAPDGYSLFLGGNAVFAVNPTLYKKVPYDPVKDFDPVSMACRVSMVLVVPPELPVRSAAELVAYLKERPGKVNFGSTGSGTTVHLAGELFKTMAGVDVIHVPYRGAAVLTDLMAGRVSYMFATTSSVKSLIQAGKLRALGTTGARRAASLPGIPTVAESGVPGFDIEAWFGVYVPAGAPGSIVEKVNQGVIAALSSTELRERLTSAGLEPVTSTPDELREYLRSEIEKWSKIVRDSGAQVG